MSQAIEYIMPVFILLLFTVPFLLHRWYKNKILSKGSIKLEFIAKKDISINEVDFTKDKKYSFFKTEDNILLFEKIPFDIKELKENFKPDNLLSEKFLQYNDPEDK